MHPAAIPGAFFFCIESAILLTAAGAVDDDPAGSESGRTRGSGAHLGSVHVEAQMCEIGLA